MARERDAFMGNAFHPAFERGRASGTLRLATEGLVFEAATQSVTLPWPGLQVSFGGSNNRLIFFAHPDVADWKVYTGDRRILQHQRLAGRPEVVRAVTRRRVAMTVGLGGLAAVLLLAAAVIGLLVVYRQQLVGVVAARVPVAWEKALGDAAYAQLAPQLQELKDPDVQRAVDQIGRVVQGGIPDRRYDFTFHVVDDMRINAFALPGGQVVVFRGLLLAADRPEQVAGVLAHEMAHVMLRHGLRNVIGSVGLVLIVRAVIGDTGGLLAVLLSKSSFLLQMKYSRDFEREADATGWDYLAAARSDPQGMIEMFRKLKDEGDRQLAGLPPGAERALALLQTHPPTAERLEFLQQQWAQYQKPPQFCDFGVDYRALKVKLTAGKPVNG